MKKQSREIIVGVGLVVISITTGILFATNTYNQTTFKNIENVKEKEKSYNIKVVAKEYVPDKLVFLDTESDKNDTKVEVSSTPVEEPKQTETKKIDSKNTETKKEVVQDPIVFDGLTLKELTAKLDRNMSSTISGMGYIYASYSLEIGIDPYLALAITLQETGCKWDCSSLVKDCNNVGGQKGGPVCRNGYKKYDTLEDGIKGYMDNIKKNYYDYGLNTAELMNSKYAQSTTWSEKVNKYIDIIKAN